LFIVSGFRGQRHSNINIEKSPDSKFVAAITRVDSDVTSTVGRVSNFTASVVDKSGWFSGKRW